MSFIVRTARIEDARAIAAVHTASTADAYAPLAATWEPLDVEARAAMWEATMREDAPGSVVIVAEADGNVVGFIRGGDARRPEPGVLKEIYVVHVAPEWRGKGVGDALWRSACGVLRGDSGAGFYVDSLAELRSASFYARRGGEVTERRTIDFCGAERTHVTYRWRGRRPSE